GPRHRAQVPRGAAGAALRPAGDRPRARARHDLHHRAHDQRGQGGRARARRRLDHRHQGPQPLGAVGAHHPRDRDRPRGPDPVRGHAPAGRAGGMSAPERMPAAAEEGRRALAAGRAALEASYARPRTPGRLSVRPASLLRRHARLIDGILKALWRESAPPRDAALVATGGYGRGELYPASDIDILILLAGEPDDAARGAIERLIGAFWDIGLEVGHSVRTVEGCIEAAAGDITIATSLLESRFLCGSRKRFGELQSAFRRALDPVSFLKAKKLEQEQRHAKHHDSPYSLEPNLKEAPGGLRDLQVIQWIAAACGIGARWSDLAANGLIEEDEARKLARHEAAFQDLRIRLHYLARRREDRIVFDYQEALAEQYGYAGTEHRRASEAMMQRYYLAAKTVTQLNTILLQ